MYCLVDFPLELLLVHQKIRAIQIIEELEKAEEMFMQVQLATFQLMVIDTCIALRTALIKNNNIYVQSGAGIVADSNAKNEFRETENKAMALLAATQYAKNLNK